MKVDIETLKDSFKIGYEAFEESREDAKKVMDYYHNRQYTDEQLCILSNRGQPAETFNVIKLFTRMLLGYYSTVVNTVRVTPTKESSIITASILGDFVDYTFRNNNFNAEGDKIKFDAIMSGLMCSYLDVKESGEKDEFGRPIYKIVTHHVPSLEVVLDPMSTLEDYSDARFIHRFKWVSKEAAIKQFGKAKVDKLDAYENFLNVEEAEFGFQFGHEFQGRYKVFDNYLIVHSIIEDDSERVWSVFWSGEEILDKKELTYKEVKFPYRIHKVHPSNKTEYYGIFREIVATQDAINQALIKIQLMINTQKAFIQDGAVENMANFVDQFNRVNAVIPVKDLSGIRIENLTREVLDQYTVIDKALDRVQRVLSINDSFLGMAYASDSGAKVKLQQNASAIALRYLTSKVEQFYRLLGWDIVNLIKQYYTAHQVIRVADEYEGNKWLEINKPAMIPTGQVDPQTGQPQMRPVFMEVTDPASGSPILDEDGNYIMAPIPTRDTEIAFTEAEVDVASIAYNDEDEKSQVVLDQFINGPLGNMLSQVDPVGYFTAGSLAVRNTKTKYSLELSNILTAAAQKLGQNMEAQQQMMMGGMEGQMSQSQAINQQSGR